MIKKILLISICIIFINCNKKENNKNIDENNIDIIKPTSIEFKPIFLGLSPKMTEEAYNQEIEKLNKSGKLVDYLFVLEINTERYEFGIQKTENSIMLNHSVIGSEPFNDLNYQISDKLLNRYTRRKDILIDVFEKKYSLNNIQIPENISLSKFNLTSEHYKLFRDKDKYILVGYSVLGSRVPSREERDRIAREKSNHPLANMGNLENPDKYIDFGFKVEIHYFHIEDMDSLLEEIMEESKLVNRIKLEEQKIKKKKQMDTINSLNEI